ncbi:hypothetical protein OPU71_06955 [Niveibacterium sp. 24ML]|nr:hypothetical protein [Niveibacterium sp. 24ML]MCX9155866.1 hypothetical protein [Niveibacterium sp. 24ML]
MWILLLEAGVALSLLLIIVWATWPKKDPARIEAPKPPETPHDGQA